MPENSNTNKYNVNARQVIKKSFTRKNPDGSSNYPTLQFGRITNTNYQKGKKTITTKKYRRIDD